MIAIDTNVLVRLIVDDDNIQARKALKLVEDESEVFISTIVLCKAAWVLESCYALKKSELINTFEQVLRINQFNIEYSEAIWQALNEYKKVNADFSDCIIATIAKANNCDTVTTFDNQAAKSDLFTLIK